ncbi:hypothetical protein C8J56DRAFT_1028310 [Mycena floridula]|nr:hypothetical protein C8J56DRAFT_1028310 [Mycena floridula]
MSLPTASTSRLSSGTRSPRRRSAFRRRSPTGSRSRSRSSSRGPKLRWSDLPKKRLKSRLQTLISMCMDPTINYKLREYCDIPQITVSPQFPLWNAPFHEDKDDEHTDALQTVEAPEVEVEVDELNLGADPLTHARNMGGLSKDPEGLVNSRSTSPVGVGEAEIVVEPNSETRAPKRRRVDSTIGSAAISIASIMSRLTLHK